MTRADLDALIASFEASWGKGEPLAIDPLLPREGDRLTVLRELVHIDLEFRLKSGQTARVEDYLKRFPELGGDAEAVLELALAEFKFRRRGERTARAEFLERFPSLREGLLRRLPEGSETGDRPGDTPTHRNDPGPELSADSLAVLNQVAPPGRYEVGPEIARGGMGAVHRCRDRLLGRDLAVKVLLPELVKRPDVLRRFVEEAQVGGQLQHPGVVPVHELGRLEDGRPFFAMKLVKGRTLAELLKERPSPAAELPRFLKVFEQVCQTLAYAHARKVIHRDLKPANVMVGAFGEVQVMDWGLAKVLTGQSERPPERPPDAPASVIQTGRGSDPAAQTVAGSVMGTYAYMSPEQARGHTDVVDERSDVFGLGGILCETLTGQPPYVARTFEDVRYQAMAANLGPALERLNRCGAESDLIALASRCLAAEPADRPRDAGAVAGSLGTYLAGVADRLKAAEIERATAQAKARAERDKRRLTVAMAGLVLLGLALGGGFVGWNEQQRRAHVEQAAGEANQAIGKARLLREQAAAVKLADVGGWREAEALRNEAVAAGEQAQSVLRAGEAGPAARQGLEDFLASLRAEAAETARGRAMLERLQRLRDKAIEVTDDDLDRALARGEDEHFVYHFDPAEYAALFREYGIDVESLPADRGGAAIGRSRIGPQLTEALDVWLMLMPTRDGGERKKLAAVANEADRDLLRGRLRTAVVDNDLEAQRQLAAGEEAEGVPVSSALLLAESLFRAGEVGPAVGLLRRVQRLHPADFWVNSKLGEYLVFAGEGAPPPPDEAVRYFTAAVVVRPDSPVARANLADALQGAWRLEEAVRSYRLAARGLPDAVFIKAKLARSLAQGRQTDEALRLSAEAVSLRPQSAWVNWMRGHVLWQVRRTDEALASYREAVRLLPTSSWMRASLGEALLVNGKVAEGAAEADQALRLKASAITYALRARVRLSEGGVAEALQEAQEAVRRWPRVSAAWSVLAEAHMDSDQPARAFDDYHEALVLEPRNPWLRLSLAAALRNRGRLEEAEACAREVLRQVPGMAFGYGEYGVTLAGLHRWGEAEDALSKAVEAAPWLRDYRRELVDVCERLGEVDRATALCQEAIDAGGSDVREWKHRLAKLYRDHGRVADALALDRAAAAADPADPAAWHGIGVCQLRAGQTDDAVTTLLKAWDMPSDIKGEIALDLGQAQLEKSRRLEREGKAEEARSRAAAGHWALGYGMIEEGQNAEGLREYREGLALVATAKWAHANAALALKRMGRYEEAAQACCAALCLNPAETGHLLMTGQSLAALGRSEEAATAFRMVLARQPGNAAARDGLGLFLMESGRLQDALTVLERGGSRHNVERCRRLVRLEGDLSAYLDGSRPPADADLLDVADLCRLRDLPAAACRFYGEAVARKLLRPEEGGGHVHEAARSAARAGCGRGTDGASVEAADRARFRAEALDWLRAELREMMKRLEEDQTASAVSAGTALAQWQRDGALAGVRDEDGLRDLPEEERQAWQSFWAEVETVRTLAALKVR